MKFKHYEYDFPRGEDNPAFFSNVTEDVRRGLIIEITDTKRDLPSIKKKMLDRKCNEKKIESILPFLVSGFSNAQKQAIDNTKEARSNWKAIAGEVYGDKRLSIGRPLSRKSINQPWLQHRKHSQIMGQYFGWRVLKILHNPGTYRRYEKVLGVEFKRMYVQKLLNSENKGVLVTQSPRSSAVSGQL